MILADFSWEVAGTLIAAFVSAASVICMGMWAKVRRPAKPDKEHTPGQASACEGHEKRLDTQSDLVRTLTTQCAVNSEHSNHVEAKLDEHRKDFKTFSAKMDSSLSDMHEKINSVALMIKNGNGRVK